MSRISFTPWKDSSELLVLRDQLYCLDADGVDLRPKAISRIAVWKLRGQFPHPIEATGLLTEAVLHDDPTRNSMFSIRATYSAAFCRFVTGFVDSKLYGPKVSMYQKAMNVGLSASFVELRHEATHRELPSLSVFRDATRRSLDWLWNQYWVHLPDLFLDPGPNAEFSKAQAKQLLQSSIERSGSNSTKSISPDSLRELQPLCKNPETISIVAQVLLGEAKTMRKNGFTAWDDGMKDLSRDSPLFLTTFIQELIIKLLQSPEKTEKSAAAFGATLFSWLEHILTSRSWAITRTLYFSSSYSNALCQDSQNPWASKIFSLLQKTSKEEAPGSCLKRRESDVPVAAASTHDMAIDSAQNHSNGWDLLQDWTFKPIGEV